MAPENDILLWFADVALSRENQRESKSTTGYTKKTMNKIKLLKDQGTSSKRSASNSSTSSVHTTIDEMVIQKPSAPSKKRVKFGRLNINVLEHTEPSFLRLPIRGRSEVVLPTLSEKKSTIETSIVLQIPPSPPSSPNSDPKVCDPSKLDTFLDLIWQSAPVKRQQSDEYDFPKICFDDSTKFYIGPNATRLSRIVYDSIPWPNATPRHVGKILLDIFPHTILATHSLHRRQPAEDPCGKPDLDPHVVADILSLFSRRSILSERSVKKAIISKCRYEAKRMRDAKKTLYDNDLAVKIEF